MRSDSMLLVCLLETLLTGDWANAGDTGDVGLIPGLGRSPGGGNDNPLQCSGLENPMDREAFVSMGSTESWTGPSN